jgi:hypothetical protein
MPKSNKQPIAQPKYTCTAKKPDGTLCGLSPSDAIIIGQPMSDGKRIIQMTCPKGHSWKEFEPAPCANPTK